MGILYICATPIGNLEDVSFRLVRTLKEVDLILAEDTRQTKKLLDSFEIKTRTTSYHKFNIKQKTSSIIKDLLDGKSIALVSDGGMPGISDPGKELIQEAILNNIQIVVTPGPFAGICALVSSGFGTDRFVFEGFLPREGKMRRRILRKLHDEERTKIFYESPHRLLKTLKDMKEIFGNINICLAREMTKKFEEFFRGTIDETINKYSQSEVLGEITIVF